jgi:hypothetical protein
MSIRDVGRNIANQSGLEKKIDTGASRLVFDILQATQYSYPIPSTVRELATNAWDSQREKEVAIEILTGKKREEDYYIRRDDEQYSASNFDSSYYDLDHFSEESLVTLRYTQRNGSGFCDTFEVIDRGVGLSLVRLENMLSLGFSTKRNTAEGFGSFGLGAKVAFSTGVPSYSITTVHNGRRFKCVCYPYSTSFTVPRFNEKGEENPVAHLQDGTTVYYEPTEEKNGTTVSFQVKRHNRSQFNDAVNEQLMYVKGIMYEIIDENGNVERNLTEKKLMHSSDALLISETFLYHSPHIVIVKSPKDQAGICYGMVDFKELELEQLYGSIGFKCPIRQSYRNPDGTETVVQEGVAVTPSREKVIWNDETKKYVLKVIEEAEKEASELVSATIRSSGSEITKWLESVRTVTSQGFDTNTVLGRLSKIVNKENINVSHPQYPELSYNTKKGVKSLFDRITLEQVSQSNGKVTINEVTTFSDIRSWNRVYVKDGNYSKAKNMMLSKESSFLTVRLKTYVSKTYTKEGNLFTVLEDTDTPEDNTPLIWKLFLEDPSVTSYDEIVVPEDFQQKVDTLDAEQKLDELSPADRRKLEEREVVQTFRGGPGYGSTFVLSKVEPKRHELLNPTSEIYWFTADERNAVEAFLTLIALDLPSTYQVTDKSYNNEERCFCTAWDYDYKINPDKIGSSPTFIQVRQQLTTMPHNENFMHWREMFNVRNGSVKTVHPLVRRAFTRKFISMELMDSDEFTALNSFTFLPELCEKYRTLKWFMHAADGYHRDNYYKRAGFNGLDDLYALQQKFRELDSDEERRQLSFRNFILTDITDVDVVDTDMVDLAKSFEEFLRPVGKLLASIERKHLHCPEVQSSVMQFLALHGRDTWEWGTEEKAPQNSNQLNINIHA